MKKIRIITAAVAGMMLISQTAGAEINRISGDYKSGEWTVWGNFLNIDSGKAAVQVLKPGKTINDTEPYAYTAEFPIDEKGDFSGTFKLNGISGEYMLRIGAGGQIFERSFNFINRDEMEEYLQKVNGVKSSAELEGVFEADYGRLKAICGISINSQSKAEVYRTLYSAIPSQGFESFDDMKRCVAEIVLLNDFMNSKSDKITKLTSLFEYFDETALPVITVWNNKEYTRENAKAEIAYMLQNKNISSIMQLQEMFTEQTLLYVLTDTNNSNSRKSGILKTASSLIDAKEYGYFSGLSEAKQSSILSRMSDKYSGLAEYVKAFDNAVREYKNNLGQSVQDGGSGGTSGSKMTIVSKPYDTSKTDNETQKNNDIFTDLDSYSWAKQAIEKLFYNDIIKGKAEGVYAPGDNVKREEFTSMVIKALGFENNSAVFDGFDDVKENDWYYNAVAAAFEKKIIKGISETEFGSGRNITRQDMTLICKQAAEAAGLSFETRGEFTVVNSYEYSDTVTQAFADQSEIADYAVDAVLAMQRAGIVKGNENGEFKPLDNMTRAEAAVVIDRLMKLIENENVKLNDNDKAMLEKLSAFGMYEDNGSDIAQEITRGETAKLLCGLLNITIADGKNDFLDCGTDNPYSPFIYTVCGNGYMEGKDGIFRSDDFLSYDEAVKIAVIALGEGVAAEENGGYPKGYLNKAFQKGILKDVEKASGDMITKRNFLKLFDNLLEEYVFKINADGTYSYSEDEDFLSVYHRIYEDKGMITANANAGICGESGVNKNSIKIGGRIMKNTNQEYDGYIGRDVTYWYRKDNDEDELVYVRQKKQMHIITLNSSQIDKFRDMEYTYTDNNSDKLKKLKVTSKANYIYNGRTIFDYNDEMLNPKSGVVTFIDYDGNGKYTENDTIIIDAYKHIVVNSVNLSKEIIYDKYSGESENSDYTLDLQNVGEYSIKDKHGDVFGLRELREWDVLAVKCAPDNSHAELILIDECYGGKLNSVANNEIMVAGNKYEISPEWRGEMPDLAKNVTVYTDLFNKAVAVRPGIASSALAENKDGETEQVSKLAVLSRYGLTEDGKTHFIKTYDGSNGFTYNEVADKLKINNNRCSNEEAENIIRENMGKAVLIETNDKNEITNITVAALPGEDDSRGLWQINYPGESLLYKSDPKNFGNRFIPGDKIFTVPEDEADYGNLEQYAFNNAAFINDRSYIVDGYTTTLNNIRADAIVYKAQKDAIGTYDTDTAMVVADKMWVVNETDEIVLSINGLCYDVISGTVSAKSYELSEKAVIVDAAGNIRDDITIDDIEPGDCIRYGMDGKAIGTIMIAYDLSEGAAPDNPGDRSAFGYGGWAYNLTEDEKYLSITVGRHPSELDMSSYETGGKYLQSFSIRNSSLVTVVNTRQNTRNKKALVTTGSMKDILTYQRAGAGCSKIFLFSSWQSFVTGIVVYTD